MDIPLALRRGWRESLRTGACYRRRQNRVAIMVTDEDGFRLILKHSMPTLEDAFAAANEVLTCINRHSTLQAMSEFIA